jgi:hypothetical protein
MNPLADIDLANVIIDFYVYRFFADSSLNTCLTNFALSAILDGVNTHLLENDSW